MSLLELLQPVDDVYFRRDILIGALVGIVTNNQDPDELGRVKLNFPWLSEDHESDWARVAAPMAGKDRGFFFLPEVDDEVLVIFEHGDIRKPMVCGGLWNGVDKPPETNSDGQNNLRVIQSRSGHQIILNDTEDNELIEVIDKTKKNKITIDSKENTITISTDKDISLSAPEGKITLECKELEVQSSGAAKIEAGDSLDIKSGATLGIEGQTVNIN